MLRSFSVIALLVAAGLLNGELNGGSSLGEEPQSTEKKAISELEALGAKISARSIEIGSTFRGDENDLERLKGIIDCPILILSGEKITDGWITPAARMPGLEELHLFQSQISDDGLMPLKECSKLRVVGVYYSSIGDRALAPLNNLPKLTHVKVYGTQMTADGIGQFLSV